MTCATISVNNKTVDLEVNSDACLILDVNHIQNVLSLSSTGIQGVKGETGSSGDYFESVSKNLVSLDYSLNYTGGELTSIVYINETDTITKTLNYTAGVLTSIVLSGDTPAGIDLTKTLTYTSGDLTGIAYS